MSRAGADERYRKFNDGGAARSTGCDAPPESAVRRLCSLLASVRSLRKREIVGYQDGARLLPDGGLSEQARVLGPAPLQVQMQLGQQRRCAGPERMVVVVRQVHVPMGARQQVRREGEAAQVGDAGPLARGREVRICGENFSQSPR